MTMRIYDYVAMEEKILHLIIPKEMMSETMDELRKMLYTRLDTQPLSNELIKLTVYLTVMTSNIEKVLLSESAEG